MEQSDYDARVSMIKLLLDELDNELNLLNRQYSVDYKLNLQVQDEEGNYVLGADESSNWNASWC